MCEVSDRAWICALEPMAGASRGGSPRRPDVVMNREASCGPRLLRRCGAGDSQEEIAEGRRRGRRLASLQLAHMGELGSRPICADPGFRRSARAPRQRFWVDPMRVEPRLLSRRMTVMALFDLRYETSAKSALPAHAKRSWKAERAPCYADRRMLEDAAPAPHGSQSGSEASVVVADGQPVSRLIDRRHLAPSLARRVRHDRPRPIVEPRVPGLVPRIDIRQAEVAAACLHEERSDLAQCRTH